jgi:hypothetical protein
MGKWEVFFYKANAITVQRLVVPWLVALYGLKYAKSVKLELVKEMVTALCSKLGFVGLMQRRRCKRIQSVTLKSPSESRVQQVSYIVTSANVTIISLCMNPCSDCMPGPAERAFARHRADVLAVLIDPFEKPIPESEVVSREVLTRVLGKSVDWSKPIIDVASNPHLEALARPGVPPIVWETKDRKKGTNARSVLDPIAIAGQDSLLDFLGTSYRYLIYDDILVYSTS